MKNQKCSRRREEAAKTNAGLQREIDERRRIAGALKNSRTLYPPRYLGGYEAVGVLKRDD